MIHFPCKNDQWVVIFFSYLSIVGDEILLNLLNKQITSLIIDINDKPTDEKSIEYFSVMFSLILNLCRRLSKFHFCPYYYRSKTHRVYFSSTNCKSATLTELKVYVNSFNECLYLFDEHFPSLSTLIINVKEIKETSRTRKNTVKAFFLSKREELIRSISTEFFHF
jgi:hypothetical protein